MSPLPAASSRFIAYSGEVCRYSGARPRLRAEAVMLSSARSDTPAEDSAGVSTSSTPRAAKNARMRLSSCARRRSASSDALAA